MSLTHVNAHNNPNMVDVGMKEITRRSATAQAVIDVGDEILSLFNGEDIRSPKGPVFQTAMIAMTMAAKRTHESVCFCHPVNVENVKTRIYINGGLIFVEASVSLHAKTGVEMEALHAASIGALNIYDMCKAMNKNILIKEIKLLCKSGGKKDFLSEEEQKKDLVGVIFIGGKSRRMGRDKYSMDMGNGKQLEFLYKLFSKYFKKILVICNQKQYEEDADLKRYPCVVDLINDYGPIGALATAFYESNRPLFITACDLPNLTEKSVEKLIDLREKEASQYDATVYYNPAREKLEPLFGVYELRSKRFVWEAIMKKEHCATNFLEKLNVNKLILEGEELNNMNHPEDLKK